MIHLMLRVARMPDHEAMMIDVTLMRLHLAIIAGIWVAKWTCIMVLCVCEWRKCQHEGQQAK